MKKNMIDYALVTPAKNEEKHIEKTIKSMISQTWLPVIWVIVNDGSTDNTGEVINRYASQLRWMKVITLPFHAERGFDLKAKSVNEGLMYIKKYSYEIIGNIDADISFEPDFMEFLIAKFMELPKLGVAGAPFEEPLYKSYESKFANYNHVSGACQIFRRKCFEEIGGYTPIKDGGIDWLAVTTARMKGWKTQTFSEKSYYHHRPIGTGNSSVYVSRFNYGKKDYYFANHPLWEMIRILHHMIKPPYFIGGFMLLCGYCYAGMIRMKRPISQELITFNRKEQMERLRSALYKIIMLKKGR